MRRMMRGLLVALLALGGVLAGAGHGWAQQATPPAPMPAPADDSPGLTAMAAVAGAIGSVFYIPFKLAVICPGMALASGASLAFTGGDSATAEYLLRVGCTGTYFITPGMVRGKEEFQESGIR
jgi:hypothetical protein